MEKLLDGTQFADLPANFEIPDDWCAWWDRQVPIGEPKRLSGRLNLLRNVWVGPDGLICQRRSVDPWSSLYGRLTRERLLRESMMRKKNPAEIPSARLVVRAVNERGTYGDYFIEFLTPLCFEGIGTAENPYLLDADFVKKYAPGDLNALDRAAIEIPLGGLLVNNLQIIPPCQAWDNFTPQTITSLRDAFGIHPRPETGRRIYLSRCGLPSDPTNKQHRSLENELDVEKLMVSMGYEILRTHEVDNTHARKALAECVSVLGTHGAALAHLAFARPLLVMEIAQKAWWVPCYLKLAHAIGVQAYRLFPVDGDLASLNSLLISIRKAHEEVGISSPIFS
jgi:hypothetical protein